MKRPGRPMFRVVLLLLAWAAAGALVNVAVVVVISAYASRGSWAKVAYKTFDVVERDAVVLQRGIPADPSRFTYKQHEARRFGWRSRMGYTSEQPLSGDDGRFVLIRVFDAGWPLLAMQGEWHSGDSALLSKGFHNAWGRYRIVTSGGSSGLDSDMLPLLPLWPGFAINTLFYGGILWLLFAAPFVLRKRRRIKRGLCPKCAYDLRGRSPASDSSVCPECGAAVPAPAPHAAPIEAKP